MPLTRARAQRAADSAVSQANMHNLMQPELLDLIIRHVDRTDLPALRLTCTQLAAAVGQQVTRIRFNLNSDESTSTIAKALKRTLARLPAVNSLNVTYGLGINSISPSVAKILTNLTRLDFGTCSLPITIPSQVQLPTLKALSLGSMVFEDEASAEDAGLPVGGMRDIAAFAPQLRELYVDQLIIGTPSAVLSHCTICGARTVRFDVAGTEEQAARQFSGMFPVLRVLSHAVNSYRFGMTLCHVPGMTALRACGCVYNFRWLSQLTNLQQLSLSLHSADMQWHTKNASAGFQRDASPSINFRSMFKDVCKLTELRRLQLTFLLPKASNAPDILFTSLANLLHLESLVLPRQLLCLTCCGGLQLAQHLYNLSSRGLKQIAFMEVYQEHSAPDSCDVCRHPYSQQELTLGELQQQLRQARQQQQQQDNQQQNHEGLLDCVLVSGDRHWSDVCYPPQKTGVGRGMPLPGVTYDHAGDFGGWGVYGPNTRWYAD